MGVCVTEGIEAVAMGVCVTEDIQRPSQSTLVAAQSVIVEDRIYLLGPSVHEGYDKCTVRAYQNKPKDPLV